MTPDPEKRKIPQERTLTKSNGMIAQDIPKPWHWTRIPDYPKARHTAGYDGTLWFGNFGFPVEVKLGWASLTPREEEVQARMKLNKTRYLILRYHPHAYYWTLEGWGQDQAGSLELLCHYLERQLGIWYTSQQTGEIDLKNGIKIPIKKG